MDAKSAVKVAVLSFAAWKMAKFLGSLMFSESESKSEPKPKKGSKIWVLANMGLGSWSISKLLMKDLDSEPKIKRENIGAVAGLVFATWTIAKRYGGDEKKKMKAPGRDGNNYMYREDFEEDPSRYFQNLRQYRRK